jgi:hypothetical protein
LASAPVTPWLLGKVPAEILDFIAFLKTRSGAPERVQGLDFMDICGYICGYADHP